MLTAIIENEDNSLVLEFPCKYRPIAEHLASIGVNKSAHEIKCIDEEDDPIKVKIFGNSEFEVMTTGRAGGMTKPLQGILPAELLSSSNGRQPRLFHRLGLAQKTFFESVLQFI